MGVSLCAASSLSLEKGFLLKSCDSLFLIHDVCTITELRHGAV